MAKKKAPFYTESSKKSISLGNLTILSFQIKHILSHTRIVQDIHFLLIHHYLATVFGLGQQNCAQVV